jgi:polyisoprenoid-binding protein YceI
MSSSFRAFLLMLAATALFSQPVAARSGSGTLELNPTKTLIEFRLPGSLHTTHGLFKLERGTISADMATGEAKGAIIVDAKSGDSGVDARDNRMKDSVLDVQKYPEIIFVPQHITGQLEKNDQFQARLQGVLTLHGAAHPIVMEVQGQLVGDSLIAKSHFSVPYVDWGMQDPSVLFLRVAKQVDIDIATAGNIVWKR